MKAPESRAGSAPAAEPKSPTFLALVLSSLVGYILLQFVAMLLTGIPSDCKSRRGGTLRAPRDRM